LGLIAVERSPGGRQHNTYRLLPVNGEPRSPLDRPTVNHIHPSGEYGSPPAVNMVHPSGERSSPEEEPWKKNHKTRTINHTPLPPKGGRGGGAKGRVFFPPGEGEEHAPGFEAFWGLYPRKEARAAAAREWDRLAPDAGLRGRIAAA